MALAVSSLLVDVFSLVTVQPAAAPVAKQLLPKTLGPSNVNIAAHVQHVPHMVSDPPPLPPHTCLLAILLHLHFREVQAFDVQMHWWVDAPSYCCVSPCFIIVR